MQQELFINKWVQNLCLAFLFACVILFAYTGNYLLLGVPFGFLFFVLLGINWKTAYMLLLFCIPASIEISFFNDTLATSLPDEPMMWLFLLLFIIVWARNPKVLPAWWWRNPVVFIVLLQFLWLLVALMYSKEMFMSLKFVAAKVWFLVSFFILPVFIFKEKKDYKLAFYLTLTTITATMLIIFVKHAMLHFDFRKIQKAIHGIYFNHVDYSTVLSMAFPLLCVAYPLTKGKSRLIRWPLLFLIAFFLVAIYLTYARAAMLAVLFAGVVALAMRFRLTNFIMPAFYGLIALLMVYMVHHNKYYDFRPDYQRTYMHKSFTDHIIATFRGQDMSSMERLYRWVAAVRMSTDRPITGYGPHAFYYYYKPYTVTAFKTYVSRNPEHSTTHNYFLYMLVEQGWPAMILYAILVIAVFALAQRVYWRFKDRFYRYATLGLTMMFAAGFVNNFFSELIETHKVGSLFYLAIALLIMLDKKSKDMEKEALDTPATA